MTTRKPKNARLEGILDREALRHQATIQNMVEHAEERRRSRRDRIARVEAQYPGDLEKQAEVLLFDNVIDAITSPKLS
jgi:hypothetical protein